jgi:hypothetical protein
MEAIRVSDDLALELWPSTVIEPEPLVRIVRRGGGQVYVRLSEVRHLINTLATAAAELADEEVRHDAQRVC